jgi:hypothetical protein
MEPPAWAFIVSLVVNLAAAAADFDYAHTFPGHKIAPRPAKTGGGANFAAVSRRREIYWPHSAPHSATSATFPAPCAVWGCKRAGGEPPPPAHLTTPAGTTSEFYQIHELCDRPAAPENIFAPYKTPYRHKCAMDRASCDFGGQRTTLKKNSCVYAAP